MGRELSGKLQQKGVYTILIRVDPPSNVKVGELGRFNFSGLYAYTGSATGKGSSSLDGRVSRHLSNSKKMRWHIDYLLERPNAEVTRIITSLTHTKSKECEVSRNILDTTGFPPIRGFGSSDCSCSSHLAYFETSLEDASRTISDAHYRAGLKPRTTTKMEF
jgi:Uri superfamily endonuclease